jgi:hypothetical protein
MMTRTLAGMMTLLLACAVALAACGGGSSGSQTDSAAQAPAQPVCLVPDVVGQSQEAAESKISGSGLQMVSSSEFDPDVPEGSVISQEPAAGTRLEPCAGDVVIVVSLGPEPGSDAPATEPEEVAEESAEPTPTPTPVPENILFEDTFDDGIKPEWGMTGSGFASVNRMLVIEDGSVETTVIGDASWEDYTVTFNFGYYMNGGLFNIPLRVQDSLNYMVVKCTSGNSCEWFKVVDGEEQKIPGSKFHLSRGDEQQLSLEMHDNIYLTFHKNEQVNRFIDDTFSNGGFSFMLSTNSATNSIKVTASP